MNWASTSFDWNQARAFLATAEEGSLSAAARAVGQTQPTLSRQVASLEHQLAVTLFERVGRTLVLTQSGMELLEHFRAMGDAATRVSIAASGQSQAIEGHVTITATEVMAAYHLPAMIKQLREIAPGITIEIIGSNDVRDLTRREADIAIRHGRPTQPDLIAKLVAETTAHLYAAPDFLDRHGRPTTAAELSEFEFVGFEDPDRMLSILSTFGLNLSRENIKVHTASGTVILELVRHGLGICVLTKDTADLIPTLEQVVPDFDPIPIPVWLVTHRELHTSRRIRLVYDFLTRELSRVVAKHT